MINTEKVHDKLTNLTATVTEAAALQITCVRSIAFVFFWENGLIFIKYNIYKISVLKEIKFNGTL